MSGRGIATVSGREACAASGRGIATVSGREAGAVGGRKAVAVGGRGISRYRVVDPVDRAEHSGAGS